MLKAVFGGKAKIQALEGSDVSRCNEDTLTSIVFERIAYLPDDIAWKFLREAAQKLPDLRVATFKTIEFWPKWDRPDFNGRFVEPDAFIQVHLSDPVVKYDIIVEAKRDPKALQKHWQWDRQTRTYWHAREQEVISDIGQKVILLAMGGFNHGRSTLLDDVSIMMGPHGEFFST